MRLTTFAAALALLAPLPALAEGGRGGDRTPAGGAFMSSYNQDPYAARGLDAPFGRGLDVSATASVPARPAGPAPRRPVRR